jgi:hypothetical protein
VSPPRRHWGDFPFTAAKGCGEVSGGWPLQPGKKSVAVGGWQLQLGSSGQSSQRTEAGAAALDLDLFFFFVPASGWRRVPAADLARRILGSNVQILHRRWVLGWKMAGCVLAPVRAWSCEAGGVVEGRPVLLMLQFRSPAGDVAGVVRVDAPVIGCGPESW